MAKIFIAIPQYKPMPEAEVMKLASDLGMPKEYKPDFKGFHPRLDVSLCRVGNSRHEIALGTVIQSTVDNSRALLLGRWKYDWDRGEKYDYMLCLDEDIEFTAEDIDKLVAADKPIIGAHYPLKAEEGGNAGRSASNLFPGQTLQSGQPEKIRWLNGGFILIRSDVLFRMIRAYPKLRFHAPVNMPMEGVKEAWALWQPFVYSYYPTVFHRIFRKFEERPYLTEDYAFCQRARNIGYDIWAHAGVHVIHWSGAKGFCFP